MPRILFDASEAELLINQRLNEITPMSPVNRGGLQKAINDAYLGTLNSEINVINNLVLNANPLTASGQYAEDWGRLVNKFRRQAKTAESTEFSQNVKFYVLSGTFGDINGGNDILLTAGTKIFTNSTRIEPGNIVYRLTSDITLLASESERYVPVVALTTGSSANIPSGSLRKHNYTNYTDNIRGRLLVTNELPISTGESIESDREFVRRYLTDFRGDVNTIPGISNSIASLAGVSNVVTLYNVDGLGTVTFFVQGQTPITSSDLLDTISNNIIAPLIDKGIVPIVRAPNYTGVAMDIDIEHFDTTTREERLQIEQQMRNSLRQLIDSLPMGSPLNISSIKQTLVAYSNRVKRIGKTEFGDIISALYIYKDTFGIRAPQQVTTSITADRVEKIILEYSIENPINIRRV